MSNLGQLQIPDPTDFNGGQPVSLKNPMPVQIVGGAAVAAGQTSANPAQDGIDDPNVAPAAGAVGIRGWLSTGVALKRLLVAAIGSPADAVWNLSGAGSVVSILKATCSKIVSGVLTVTINGALPAGTNLLGYFLTPTAAPAAGQVKIATTGTAVAIAAAFPTNGAVITAKATNAAQTTTFTAAAGGSTVNTAYDGTGTGYPLAPGGSISFGPAASGTIYVNGTAGDVFFYAGS